MCSSDLDPTETMILADRVVVLDQGVVQQIGRPLEVYDKPSNRLVAGFFGWPSMNLLDGVLTQHDESLSLKCGEVTLPMPEAVKGAWQAYTGKAVTLGIRPQHLRLVEEGNNGLLMDVSLVEPLGSTTLVTVQQGALQLTVQCDGRQTMSEGQKIRVEMDMNRVHLFDRGTGQALV